jgi:hypothetical protein
MKKIVILSMVALSLIISAQNIEKKCKTCGKVLSACSYRGRHPNPIINEPNKTTRPNKPQKPEPYIERTETKRPGEEYEIKGKFGSSDLALVKLRGKYGFINKEEKEIIPLKYDNVYCGRYISNMIESGWPSYEKYISVSQNSKWGFVNQKGELVIPITYSLVKPSVYDDDISILCKKDGKWGAIGQDGSIHVPFIYDELGNYYNGHPCYAQKDGKYGFIDEFNNVIVPFKYSTVHGFPYDGILAAVCENGKYGYVDLKGNEVIPMKYEFAGSFNFINDKLETAIGGIVVNGKLGFINGKDELVIPCIYDYEVSGYGCEKELRGGFMGPTGVVKKGGKWGIINRKGEILVPFLYDDYYSRSSSGDNSLRKDGKTFYFDKGGNMYSTEKERNDSSRIRLARKGFPDEQAWIGCYYYKGNNGYPKDYKKALYWFDKAAGQNDGHALYHLGNMYEYGYGVEKNYYTAMGYYNRSINASETYRPRSLLRLGEMFYYGRGFARNYKEAFAYYSSSAELGNSRAMYSIGWMYEHGPGVEKDINKAKDYYEKSAKKGNEEAKKKLQELSSTSL